MILKSLLDATTSLNAIQASVNFQPDTEELSTGSTVSRRTTPNDKQPSPQHLTVSALPGRPTSSDKQLPPDTSQSLATQSAPPVTQGKLCNKLIF